VAQTQTALGRHLRVYPRLLGVARQSCSLVLVACSVLSRLTHPTSALSVKPTVLIASFPILPLTLTKLCPFHASAHCSCVAHFISLLIEVVSPIAFLDATRWGDSVCQSKAAYIAPRLQGVNLNISAASLRILLMAAK
jgi:hypothetical protein